MEPDSQGIRTISSTAALDLLEDLGFVDGWRLLTTIQQKVLYTHLQDPTLSKRDLARQAECSESQVWRLFASPAFSQVVDALTATTKAALRLKALKTIDECMSSEDDAVRLRAALAVAADSGEIRPAPTTIKDNKIMVVWGAGKKKASVSVGGEKVIEARD